MNKHKLETPLGEKYLTFFKDFTDLQSGIKQNDQILKKIIPIKIRVSQNHT